jgi:hypothetical protein
MQVDTDVFEAIVDQNTSVQSELGYLRGQVGRMCDVVERAVADSCAPAAPAVARRGQGRPAKPRQARLRLVQGGGS